MKILIAEDDPNQRRLLTVHLERASYQVAVANDGLAAWELMEREHHRFLITDWMMPELDGPELIRRIRAANFPDYTYTMLLTALDGKEQIVKGLEAGADDYLTKPFNSAELRMRVTIGERILGLESKLREMATHDRLTGLFNRHAFDQRLADEVQRARRYGRPLSLILLDLDNFKSYNDAHGHPAGDGLLSEIGSVLKAGVRGTDFIARYGGEEFVVVLPETDHANALIVAEKIRSGAEAYPFPLRESQPGGAVTVSVGVASFPEGAADPGSLLEAADRALYQAKHAGRNRVAG
ncbi:MAG: GGDEF domain-containing protein [Anaerolineales bacterium]